MTLANTIKLVDNPLGNLIDNNGNTLTIAGKIVDADPLNPGAVTFTGASAVRRS